MSRPPDVRNDNVVDALILAGASGEIERTFLGQDLPRLGEAGVREASVQANLKFSEFDGQPVVTGRLGGELVLTCQRCMRQLVQRLDESFEVLVATEERTDEPGGYEPVVANPSRLDVRWLVEDQALLALPLVAMHAPEECKEQSAVQEVASEQQEATEAGQKPFQNLRDMMRKR
jgi:uncharacterized protein